MAADNVEVIRERELRVESDEGAEELLAEGAVDDELRGNVEDILEHAGDVVRLLHTLDVNGGPTKQSKAIRLCELNTQSRGQERIWA